MFNPGAILTDSSKLRKHFCEFVAEQAGKRGSELSQML